jgi:TfoX/Sxy family transcriptional regulator of competence genes
MHSNPKLTERLRAATTDQPLEERVMFGGVAFFLRGNFCVGIYHDLLVLRLGEEQAEHAIFRPHVVPMDITGKPMRGWVMVKPSGCRTKPQIESWLEKAIAFVSTLPVKQKPAAYPKLKQ